MDRQLRLAQQLFAREPTYQNLVRLEIARRRIYGPTIFPAGKGLEFEEGRVVLEGEPWDVFVYHRWSGSEYETPEIVHVTAFEDEADIEEIDIMPLLSDAQITELADKIYYDYLDPYY